MSEKSSLYISVKFASPKELETALTFLKMHMAQTKEGHGHDFGMGDNWIFDAYVSNFEEIPQQETVWLTINGNIHWTLNEPQAWGLVDFFKKRGALDDMEFEYSEQAWNMQGKYIFKDGRLEDHYIDSKDPVWDRYHGGDITQEELEEHKVKVKEVPKAS